MALSEGQLTKRYRTDWGGGVNMYLSPRQIKDNESPNATNCDFKGRGGIGNRDGYRQLGSVSSGRTETFGMTRFKTASINQMIRWVSNGTNVALSYSTGGSWTDVTTSTFTHGVNMDTVQAGGKDYTFNGTDTQYTWDGTTLATNATEGKTLLYGAYFDKRLWGVDPSSKDTLCFSTQYGDATKSLSFNNNGTSSEKGTVTILPGSGVEIRGIKSFKNALYIWLFPYGIYRLKTTSTINVFSVELVTNSVGCVSFRSIDQVGEDIYFAADDGVYSMGDVGTYTEVRTTNKSARIQEVFDNLSGANKAKLVGRYFNFKYHLFYSLFGSSNDSCVPYDVRYQGWQDWRDMAANDALVWADSTGEARFFFGEPSTGKVQEMYVGNTNDGTTLRSVWYSKSFDEDVPDIIKLFMDTTFIFGVLDGNVTATVIFNDSEISSDSETFTQSNPQGGFGRDVLGKKVLGGMTNTITVTQLVNQPLRLRAKGQKFSIQYLIVATGNWRLDIISQTFIPFGHYKFPSANKLN